MRRGRPRHDDVLTPREWEVLDLLREGLTNDQIAARLGVSHDTAKFHVSEILGKLGVESRREAALWAGRPKVAFGLAPILAFLDASPVRRLAAAAIGVAAVALALLAVSVVIMDNRDDGGDDSETTAPTLAATLQVTSTATPTPGATAGPTPTHGPREPAFAPDGRTGEPRLDAIIDDMLTADAAGLAERHARAEVSPDYGGTRIPTDTWTQQLAASGRRLYAVFRREVHQDIYLEVTTPAGVLEGWQVIVQAGRVIDIYVRTSAGSGANMTPEQARASVLQTPDIARDYAGYLVLPPRSTLPQSPPAHPLSTRTGDANVDAILTLIEAGDAPGLAATVATPNALRVRQCEGNDTIEGAAYVDEWAVRAVDTVRGVQAVSRLPESYFPAAEHMIVLTTQVDRFWWQLMGILEQDGKVVALVTGEGCTLYAAPDGTYFPRQIAPGERNLLIAPPTDGPAGLDASRNALRTGVAIVDAVLDAVQAADRETLAGLITYTPQQCHVYDYAPPCPEGSPPGTPVDVLEFAVCHGGYVFPAEGPDTVIGLFDGLYIYAIAGRTPDTTLPPALQEPAGYAIILAPQEPGSIRSIGIGPDGVTSLRGSCGNHHPEWWLGGGEPEYLLPPI
jgi:DNA-binding CsgD family transcriptional regulator